MKSGDGVLPPPQSSQLFLLPPQGGCSNLLKGDTRASRANVTEQQYQNIFCSNMMKTNQDVVAAGLTEQTVDIFTENSEWRSGLDLASRQPVLRLTMAALSSSSSLDLWIGWFLRLLQS